MPHMQASRYWVALRKESVDRNNLLNFLQGRVCVALRKESVDRNLMSSKALRISTVALRKESVDRNLHQPRNIVDTSVSLSARRAWIEMSKIMILVFGLEKRRSPQGERG